MINILNKYWLKITNKREYLNFKNKINKDKELINFKNYLEKDLNEIQLKIKSRKELNFLHSGASGDLVNSLPVIKHLSRTHRCNLFVGVDKKLDKYRPNNYSPYLLPSHTFKMLFPLLKSQKYISKIEKFAGQNIDINFDLFRKFPVSLQFDNLRYYFHVVGMQPDLSLSYIDVDEHKIIKNKIVIHRTLRYRNALINYKFLSKFDSPVFIGIMKEYEDLKKDIKNLEFYNCKDLYEMAMIIKSCRFFIGNSSIGHSIAEGIKVPRILEACPDFPAAYPHGDDAFDFYFQNHFENQCSYFDKKYKKIT